MTRLPRFGSTRWSGAMGLLVLSAWSVACASTGAVPRPFPTPGSPAPRGAPDSPDSPASPASPASPGSPGAPATAPARGAATGSFDSYALVGTALTFRGAPYRNGGGDPNGFDCSGFTQYVYAQYGVSLPRAVREQYRFGKSVEPEDLSPGDLVFFSTTEPGASHVAIAIGGDEFVHAPSSAGVVRVERLGSTYWSPRFIGARRLTN